MVSLSGNDENVLIPGGVLLQITDFLREVPFHPAADGGVELRKIADFQ
jgi:hypothetical protein